MVPTARCVWLKGETTIGYDASQDHAWLVEEMELWIFNNLWSRWASVARRQRATERYGFLRLECFTALPRRTHSIFLGTRWTHICVRTLSSLLSAIATVLLSSFSSCPLHVLSVLAPVRGSSARWRGFWMCLFLFSSLLTAFSQQFSGYGASQSLVDRVLRAYSARLKKGPPSAEVPEPERHGEDDYLPRHLGNDLTLWDKERVMELVRRCGRWKTGAPSLVVP